MIAALDVFMTDVAYHVPWSADDPAGGPPEFGTPTRRRCRIEEGTWNVMNAEGQEVVSRRRVFVEGPLTLDARDRLILQDSLPTEEDIRFAPLIIRPALQKDVDGTIDHAEVYL